MSVGQQFGVARIRPGADRSGGGGRTAGAVHGRSPGGNLQFGRESQPAHEAVERRWQGRRRDQPIAAMHGIEAELAVAGIAGGGVADQVAYGDNLQDREQERSQRDAELPAPRRTAIAETVDATSHTWLDSSDRWTMQVAGLTMQR